MSRKIYLDLDGVACDMIPAAVRRLGLPPTFRWPAGVWDVTEATGVPRDEFYARIADHAFWADEIQPTRAARDIFNAAAALVGLANIRILTCPTSSPFSASGKLAWVTRHFPELRQHQVMLACNKAEVAGPGRVLLDDQPENVRDWRLAGGDAILVPAVWNPRGKEDPLAAVTDLRRLFTCGAPARACPAAVSFTIGPAGVVTLTDAYGSELRTFAGGSMEFREGA